LSKTFDEIRRLKKPNEVSVELLLDPEISRVIEELERRHEREVRMDAKHNRTPEAPKIAKELESLRESVEDKKTTFTFRDPGRQKFDALVDAHPPTAKDKKENNYQWNPDSFVPALLSLCSVDPKLTEEEGKEIYNEWGRGDVEALFNAALQASLEQASIPFTKRDTDEILASVQRLITQQKEESPTDSS
jgi:predicted transcriptional regulator